MKRTTCNYKLKDKNKIVYEGITNNISRRIKEHIRSGKKFTSCVYSAKRTRKSALLQEAKALKRYRSNQGRLPKYNKML